MWYVNLQVRRKPSDGSRACHRTSNRPDTRPNTNEGVVRELPWHSSHQTSMNTRVRKIMTMGGRERRPWINGRHFGLFQIIFLIIVVLPHLACTSVSSGRPGPPRRSSEKRGYCGRNGSLRFDRWCTIERFTRWLGGRGGSDIRFFPCSSCVSNRTIPSPQPESGAESFPLSPNRSGRCIIPWRRAHTASGLCLSFGLRESFK